MAKIEFPGLLKLLLEESDLQAPLRALADQIGNILSDNKLLFFPDYTDHGIDHVNRVLQFEVELVPKAVWEHSQNDSNPRLLCDADAAVIIGATILHDIAMHLREEGFRELVSPDSRFQPLPWFKDAHEDHSADRLWHELWEEYVREAKRFSERDLAKIIGEKEARDWKFNQLPDEIGQWVVNHYLIIGEFIRRHHARLAHEIAIYGFPGLPVGSGEHQFPAMGTEKGHLLGRLADLIGLTARSHGMNLRTCKSFLDSKYPGTPRPMRTAVLYTMALLRVADYFQIDRLRAPAVLLQLRNPQSPVSVQEWKKHLAVLDIGPATDPRGKMVTVSADICLSLYLQLQELLKDMQAEMDHSTAVLDEVYGTRSDLGLDLLNLAIRRVYSNLHDTAFRENLPYVPERTGFRVDPNLLTLLVEPLYGKNPSVGVRELMQNAVDAVCELDAWSKAQSVDLESLDLPKQDGDVLIEFIERENGTWFLRVRDRGIGMTSDTIKNYFLRAGASFRNSEEWMKEFVDDDGKPRVVRAGRFGIGAFAVFLLGPSFRLWTRHATADNSSGYMIEASADSQLIEIQRVDSLPVGTTVEVEISSETAINLECEETSVNADVTDWFCWNWPKVVRHVVRNSKTMWLNQRYVLSIDNSQDAADWFVFHPVGFDAVYWTFFDAPSLSCNGVKIAGIGRAALFSDMSESKSIADIARPALFSDMSESIVDAQFDWPFETYLSRPRIAILDSAANLPLTIKRDRLLQDKLPFLNELVQDVLLSFIAHILVCGPTTSVEALSLKCYHPLFIDRYGFKNRIGYGESFDIDLEWCVTSSYFIPADPWLYTLLNVESCYFYGAIESDNAIFSDCSVSDCSSIMVWNGMMKLAYLNDYKYSTDVRDLNDCQPMSALSSLVYRGIRAIGDGVTAAKVIMSLNTDRFKNIIEPMEAGKTRTEFTLYKQLNVSGGQRTWFGTETAKLKQQKLLDTYLEKFENICLKKWGVIPDIIFASEIQPKQLEPKPESLIAKLWYKCLGAKAIPFDPVAREALIADGCKHPELKRHIEAWQEMKRTGSKWVIGE